MPPSGTRSSSKSSGAGRDSSRGLGKGAGGSAIGKSSSKSSPRGPTGPKGQARTSPAGGKAGSVSRSSSGARGPTGPSGQARTSPAGGKAGAVTRSSVGSQKMVGTPRGYVKKADIQRVDREMAPILDKATGLLSVIPAGRAISVASSVPKVRSLVSGAQKVFDKVSGRTAANLKKAKQISDLEKRLPQLERMKQSEAIRLGKPSKPGKLPDKLPPMSLRQIREANKPIRGYDAWNKVQDRIDDVTRGLGLGTGEVARGVAAGVTAGVQEGSRGLAQSAFGEYKKGGLVKKKPGNSKRKKK